MRKNDLIDMQAYKLPGNREKVDLNN